MGGFNLANLSGGPMMPQRFGGDPVGGPVPRAPGFGGPMWPQPPGGDPTGGPIARQPGFPGPTMGGPPDMDPGRGGYPFDPRMTPPTPQPMPPIARGPGDGWPVQPPWGGQPPRWPQPPGGIGDPRFGGGGFSGFGQGNPMMMLHQLGGFGMRSMY